MVWIEEGCDEGTTRKECDEEGMQRGGDAKGMLMEGGREEGRGVLFLGEKHLVYTIDLPL